MVTLQILVLPFLVRIRVAQLDGELVWKLPRFFVPFLGQVAGSLILVPPEKNRPASATRFSPCRNVIAGTRSGHGL